MSVFQRQMFANGGYAGGIPSLSDFDGDVDAYRRAYQIYKRANPLFGNPSKEDYEAYRNLISSASKKDDSDIQITPTAEPGDPFYESIAGGGGSMGRDIDFENLGSLLPNQIRLSNGSIINFEEGIKKIQSGAAGGGMDIYPILNAERDGSIELGANVRAALRSFAERDMPTPFKVIGLPEQGIYTDVGNLARTGILSLKEMGREGLENFIPIFGGEASIDNLGIRAEYKDGDPRGFALRGGRSREELDELITGLSGQTQAQVAQNMLSDAPSKLAPGSDNIDEELEKIKETDLENLPKPKEAGDTAKMVRETEPEGEREEEITSEEAPRRNFAEFARSPDFIRFARNVGKGLVTTGEIGKGLAIGAAGAAEEKYAEEVAATEAQSEILKELAKKGGMADVTDRQKILTQQESLNENVRTYNNAVVAEELVNEVIRFAEGNDDLTTFASKVGSTVDKLMIAANLKEGTDVRQLSDTTRAQIALDILTNANIKEILGESGRTISNIDREIAQRIAGDLNMRSLQSVAELKMRLENNASNILEKKNEAQRNIKARVKFLAPYKDQVEFDDEILKIYFGELGQRGIPDSQLSGERIRLYIK